MTVTVFLVLWAFLSVFTSIFTQAVKSFIGDFKKSYPSNVIALVIAMVLGIGVTALYYAYFGIDFTPLNIICMIVMGVLNWIGSMVGYDKVKQAVVQLINNSTDSNTSVTESEYIENSSAEEQTNQTSESEEEDNE